MGVACKLNTRLGAARCRLTLYQPYEGTRDIQSTFICIGTSVR